MPTNTIQQFEHIWRDGESYTYPIGGTFANAESSEASIQCENVSQADAGIAFFMIKEDGGFRSADGRKVGKNDPTQIIDGLACAGSHAVVPPPSSGSNGNISL